MSKNSRRARENFTRYINSNYRSIFDAYEKPSRRKISAWEHCKNLCDSLGGFNLKVISKNCHMFTAGFEYMDEDSGTELFMYITPSYEIVVSPC